MVLCTIYSYLVASVHRSLHCSRPLLPSPRLCSSPGLDIHFIHVKPPQLPSGRTPKPLLMVHGWPGSFYEFYKIIPLLTDPKAHGLSDEHVFEVICPSIPGYGFSEASSKKGTGCWRVAHARLCLM